MRNKKASIFLTSLSLILLLVSGINLNVIAKDPILTRSPHYSLYQNENLSLRQHRLEWRYKVINGVLYKRLYDHSINNWVGNWIKV